MHRDKSMLPKTLYNLIPHVSGFIDSGIVCKHYVKLKNKIYILKLKKTLYKSLFV